MQIELSDQYSPEEIEGARHEILELQNNLNEIEKLYKNFYSTLVRQQTHFDQIQTTVQQTEIHLDKGSNDIHQILQLRKKQDKYRSIIIVFILTTACFFFFVVILVLVNVIKTFGFKRINQSSQ